MMRKKLGWLLVGLIVGISPLLMAPSGGLPSRPRFQAVGVGVTAGAAGTVTATNFIGNVGGIATSDLARLSTINTFTTAASSGVNGALYASSAVPLFGFNETDGTVDNRLWTINAQSDQLRFAIYNDAGSASATWLTVDRTGTTVDSIAFATPTMTYSGNTFINNSSSAGGGSMRFQVSGATKAYFGVSGVWEGDASNDAFIAGEVGQGIRFYVNGSATETMTINSGGSVVMTGALSVAGSSVQEYKNSYAAVNGVGTCAQASGYPAAGFGGCSRSSAGHYVVTVSGYTDEPICVASNRDVAGTAMFVAAESTSTTSVTVQTRNSAGTLTDGIFTIRCVGK